MPAELKQNQTAHGLEFRLYDAVTGNPATGKAASVSVTLSKNGGAFAACAGLIVEIGNGWYQVAANATDCNTLGLLLLRAVASGCLLTEWSYQVVARDPDAAVSSHSAADVWAVGTRALSSTGVDAVADGVLDRSVSEPVATGFFGWPLTLRKLLRLLGVTQANKQEQTANLTTHYASDDATPLLTSVVENDGTTLTRERLT